jgi:hypothetical protein
MIFNYLHLLFHTRTHTHTHARTLSLSDLPIPRDISNVTHTLLRNSNF